ncbi:AraC family transcriptional regulator ligand-binding domain-containing protein [Defluviimonas aestuarii]|uniref:AraC family transcriptional regulator n=1 Tax=Albidovulum aestuarii TaxID=1130726 RepID=UPI00249AC5B5|nr:AraC family transcriptional regulator [Defluviimonas aestuarii]MDI3337962.1 AraC family transcriptional regulator ligand-binding domain-containing protein [Defluviimonas aestuarii]
MPTVTSAFAHAMASAARLTLTPEGQVMSGTKVIHQLPPMTGDQIDDQSHFTLIDLAASHQPDRMALIAAYADAIGTEDLGALGLALKSAPTLGDSLARLERYFRLLTDTAVYWLDRDGNRASLGIEGCTPDHAALTLRNECALAAVVRNMHAFVRDGLTLDYVTFRHACPDDPMRYAAHFGCRVIFGAPRDAIAMPVRALDLPNRIGDKAISDFLTCHLDRELNASSGQPPMRVELSRRLSSALSTGVPHAAALACEMGMSERTFFRRLAEEGTTYRDVVRDVQIRLARELLERGDCSIAEVAFLTGFAEQSTFGRAFKRWIGQAPAEFRNGASAQPRPSKAAILAGTAQKLAGRTDTIRAVVV